MAKLTLATITSGYSTVDRLNSNFDAIEEALENTLSRDGSSPNNMEANIDMDSHRILNLPAPLSAGEPLRLGDLSGDAGSLVEEIENFFEAAEQAKTDALAAQAAAEAAQTGAETAETNAETAATNAAASEVAAEAAQTAAEAAQATAETVVDSLVLTVQVAASDETTALTVGAGKVTFRMPYAMNLTAVRASLTTAQTSGSILTVDINEGGVSILSTKLTIDNGEKTSTTAVTPAVISDAALADDAEISIDIDQVGDGTAKGLKVTLIGEKP